MNPISCTALMFPAFTPATVAATSWGSLDTIPKKIIIDKTNNLSDDIVANINDNKYYESDSEEIIAIKNVLEAI